MPVINIRVFSEEKKFLEKDVNFSRNNISELMRSNSLQSAELLVHFETYKKLMKEHEKNDQSSYRSNALEEEGIPTNLLFELVKLTERKLNVYPSKDDTIYWLE